jgi:spore germination protein
MIIHIVQPGETMKSISDTYKIPASRLIIENGITNPDNLVVGQTIVIVYPQKTYTVQEGDTIADIAVKNCVSIIQILQNNPYLSDRKYIFPGETIVISYDTNKIKTIGTSGYTYPFIDINILKKTLPFLTYLTIFNYRVTKDGDIIDINDSEIIQLAKDYGVAPMMMLSTLTELGEGSADVANTIYYNEKIQDHLIDNIMNMLEKKGYYGINFYLQFIRPENQTQVEKYIERFAKRLRSNGYRIIITVTPRFYNESTGVNFEKIDYTKLAQMADGILFLTYAWGYSFGPPSSITPINLMREIINYAITIIPPDKLFLGIPIIGYDWQLPYISGVSKANAITTEGAIQLAAEAGIAIQFDEVSQSPYFFYMERSQDYHIVWFKDARSINALISLIAEYELHGTSIWNLMYYFDQMWYVINTTYDIEKVPDVNQFCIPENE